MELKKNYAFDVEIVKKPEVNIFSNLFFPKYPFVMIGKEVIYRGREEPIENLAQRILEQLEKGTIFREEG